MDPCYGPVGAVPWAQMLYMGYGGYVREVSLLGAHGMDSSGSLGPGGLLYKAFGARGCRGIGISD